MASRPSGVRMRLPWGEGGREETMTRHPTTSTRMMHGACWAGLVRVEQSSWGKTEEAQRC